MKGLEFRVSILLNFLAMQNSVGRVRTREPVKKSSGMWRLQAGFSGAPYEVGMPLL